jgi:hypothetical protein
MVLAPSGDRYSRGAPVDGMHPECAALDGDRPRHLLLAPELWGDSLPAADRAAA